MIQDLGTCRPGVTLYIPFHTFDSNDPSASVTLTGLATTDIEIYKDGGTTQRASDNGYALLDTDGIDIDGITGIHGISVSLADNSTAGFYAAGSQYWIVISSITVDAATVNFILATFRIGYEDAVINTTIATLSSQTSFTLTSGPAEDDALNGQWCIIHDVASAVQLGKALILDYTGSTKTVTLAAGTTFTAAATDNISIMGMAPLQPTTTGRTLDVSTGGEAGLDWANIGSPTTAQNLSATNIDVDQVVASVSGAVGSVTGLTAATVHSDLDDIQTRLPAALVGGRIDANVGAISSDATAADNAEAFFDGTGYAGTNNVIPTVSSVTAIATGGITAGSIAADAIGASELAADAVTEIQSGLATAANLATVAGYIDTEITDIQNRLPAALVGGRMDSSVGADGITNVSFATGSITAAAFAADAITTAAFANDAISAAKLDSDVAVEILNAGFATAADQTTIITMLTGLAPVNGTIGATGNDTTHLHLAGLTYGNDAINSMTLVIKDVSTGLFYSRWIEDWADTGDLATVATLPFTPQASTDLYWLLPTRADVTGGSGLDAAGVRAALGMASANLDTQLDALPTNAELATALGTADDAVLAAIAALNNLSQANIRTALGMASANLDTQLDALPTNAELATALGTADDAVLAAIAALNNLSQANVRTAVGLASANLDTQLAAMATAANLATLAGYVDTEVAAIKTKTDNLPTDPADASDIAASFASIASTLSTLAAYVDTEVAAIKAKTDSLTFTVAGVVDSNIQRVNDVAVAGTGASGDEWGPA